MTKTDETVMFQLVKYKNITCCVIGHSYFSHYVQKIVPSKVRFHCTDTWLLAPFNTTIGAAVQRIDPRVLAGADLEKFILQVIIHIWSKTNISMHAQRWSCSV